MHTHRESSHHDDDIDQNRKKTKTKTKQNEKNQSDASPCLVKFVVFKKNVIKITYGNLSSSSRETKQKNKIMKNKGVQHIIIQNIIVISKRMRMNE